MAKYGGMAALGFWTNLLGCCWPARGLGGAESL